MPETSLNAAPDLPEGTASFDSLAALAAQDEVDFDGIEKMPSS